VALLGLLSGCSVDEVFAFGWPQGGISDQSQRMLTCDRLGHRPALSVPHLLSSSKHRKRGDELPPQTRYNCRYELLYSVAPFLVISVLF